ncbi:MAG: hypothetical protein EHM21_12630 [Chloroflexi bacterium]|nr:MAG: hypothetical protein EHM21_12630 [Chloroflexota bacterium]
MIHRLSAFVDDLSEFIAHRKGLLPITGLALVMINFLLQLFPTGWLAQTNFFLHLGVILAIIGFLLARVL